MKQLLYITMMLLILGCNNSFEEKNKIQFIHYKKTIDSLYRIYGGDTITDDTKQLTSFQIDSLRGKKVIIYGYLDDIYNKDGKIFGLFKGPYRYDSLTFEISQSTADSMLKNGGKYQTFWLAVKIDSTFQYIDDFEDKVIGLTGKVHGSSVYISKKPKATNY